MDRKRKEDPVLQIMQETAQTGAIGMKDGILATTTMTDMDRNNNMIGHSVHVTITDPEDHHRLLEATEAGMNIHLAIEIRTMAETGADRDLRYQTRTMADIGIAAQALGVVKLTTTRSFRSLDGILQMSRMSK
jgi:hypothetical protein